MKVSLWAKIMKDTKIINQDFMIVEDFNIKLLDKYLKEICYKLDLETPILLSKHFRYLDKYNIVKFTKNDFIDYINFDCLIIEKSEN